MSLQDRVQEILTHMSEIYDVGIKQPRQLADMLEGRLLPYVEEKMRAELSDKAYARAKGRIPPINILDKLIGKLSQLYNDPVDRTAPNANDEELMNEIAVEMDLDEMLQHANKLLNLHKYFALEPYVNKEGKRQIRVLPAYQFSVISDDMENPLKPTLFIKRMGTIWEVDQQDPQKRKIEKVIYYCYTAEEFMVIDSTGAIRSDFMGVSDGKNPIGEIPLVYVSASKISLIPAPSSDTFAMVTLYPLLMADLNYAIQFSSHSILYGIDVEIGALDGNPDSFWDIKSTGKEGSTPQIGTIKPEVNIAEVGKHTKDLIGTWLDMKGIKQSTIGAAEVDNSASGVAKMIDSGDTTETRKAQILVLENAEQALWSLIAKFQAYWVANRLVEDTRVFSKDFEMNVTYGEQKPVVDSMEDLQKLKLKLELGLISEDAALREANPSLDDAGIEALKKQIAEEKAERMASLPSPLNPMQQEEEGEEQENEDEISSLEDNAPSA